MSNVKSIFGHPVAAPGQPDMNVVAQCEWLLEAARKGDISFIGYVVGMAHGEARWQYTGSFDFHHIGAIHVLAQKITMHHLAEQ